MPKGGARARSGPAPDPNALPRVRDKGEWKVLPKEGRTGTPPQWPLPPDVRAQAQLEHTERRAAEVRDQWANAEDSRKAASVAKKLDRLEGALAEMRAVMAQREQMELALWAELWAMPQALVWERQSQQWEVALYARRMIEAQERDSAVNLSTLVRQMADSLGLTTPGLRSNRWTIEADPSAISETSPAEPARSKARDRLKVVSGGGD